MNADTSAPVVVVRRLLAVVVILGLLGAAGWFVVTLVRDSNGKSAPTTAAAPTATSSPIPSASPSATPLPELEGKIVSTSPATNSFVLARGSGATIQVDVNSNTHFGGAASSLGTLGSGGYWSAEVRGVYESNGNFLASSVDTCRTAAAFDRRYTT